MCRLYNKAIASIISRLRKRCSIVCISVMADTIQKFHLHRRESLKEEFDRSTRFNAGLFAGAAILLMVIFGACMCYQRRRARKIQAKMLTGVVVAHPVGFPVMTAPGMSGGLTNQSPPYPPSYSAAPYAAQNIQIIQNRPY